MMMESVLFFPEAMRLLMISAVLGVGAGIAPGPLMVLILTQTLRQGKTAGLTIACAPLLTDLPIILVTFFVFKNIAQLGWMLALVSFLGAGVMLHFSWEAFRFVALPPEEQTVPPAFSTLKKGLLTNLFSPHPYLFWATIGTPYAFQAFQQHWLVGALFFLIFYGLLIGAKMIMVLLIAHSRQWIDQKVYPRLMKGFGLVFLFFAFSLCQDGMHYWP